MKSNVQLLDIDAFMISRNNEWYRRATDHDKKVVEKLKEIGLDNLPPILVRPTAQTYSVLDGNHRIRVAIQTGRKQIWATVKR